MTTPNEQNDTIKFLKELQNEMLTQDPVCQADPRFWVVMQKQRIYGIDVEYDADGEVIMESGEVVASTFKEAVEYLRDNLDCHVEEIEGQTYILDCDYTEMGSIDSIEEAVDLLNEYWSGYELVYYREIDVIVPNTFFLTNRECKEHIARNHYHYHKDAHSYAMTAWRSPQVEKLYDIIQKTDWDNINIK